MPCHKTVPSPCKHKTPRADGSVDVTVNLALSGGEGRGEGAGGRRRGGKEEVCLGAALSHV